MKKSALSFGATLVIVALGGMGYKYAQRGVVSVQTGQVERKDLAQVVTASGEIAPRNYVNIGANNAGRITDLYVSEGDEVKPGQKLAKLETVQPAAEVAAQEASLQLFRAELVARKTAITANTAKQLAQDASLRRINAELHRVRSDHERIGELLEEKLISRQDYDRSRAEFESAVASVEESRARIEELQAQRNQLIAQEQAAARRVDQADAQLRRLRDVLAKHYSVAPLAGIVTNLPVRAGETVVPGIQNSAASLIMTIADMSIITAEIKVDETDIVNVELNQVAEVQIDALSNTRFTGRVIEIGNTALLRSTGLTTSQTVNTSQEAKDFKVIVALDHPSVEIRPGMSCTARITTATRQEVLTLPIQALTVRPASVLSKDNSFDDAQKGRVSQNGESEVEGVFVIQNNRVIFEAISTGITGATHIEVTRGLNVNQEIVTGSYKVLRTLTDRARVRVENNEESSSWWKR